MSNETYNGWTNYETWLVKLWIDNEQAEQEYWLERASVEHDNKPYRLADELKNCFVDAYTDLDLQGMFADMMGAAFSNVNWREIAESLINDAEEIEG